MSSSTSLDDLPVEMICALFKHLCSKDLVVCSMVNKRLHSIYAGFRLHRLVVIDDYELNERPNLERRIEERCSIETFNRLAEKPLLSNLKHLSLYGYRFKFDPNKLKAFSQLAHLEFDIECFHRKKVNLNLLKLKVLVSNRRNWDTPLCIECPELNVLIYREFDRNLLKVKHPETIRKLDTDMVGAKLDPFKSVESLVTKTFEMVHKTTLLSLPRLKELRYNEAFGMALLNSTREVGTLDRLKRTLREFLDDVKALRGPDFKFLFAGFQLTKTMLDQIDFDVQVFQRNGREYETTVFSEYIYMKNCKLIDPDCTLDFICGVDYPRLMKNAPEELPWYIFKKFTGVEWIRAKEAIEDENHFLRFLKSQSHLKTLQLYNHPPLNQEFYNQLPTTAHRLTSIEVRRYEENGENGENEPQLNFDFIGQLSRLTNLQIDKNFLSFESLTSLIRSSGKLEKAFFRFRLKGLKGKWFFISKRRCPKVWNVQNCIRILCEGFVQSMFFEDPEEILNYFERLQNDKP